ncbi:hypothetical protein LCGC14_0346360 [marine sediment metagenome]|uniref:Uncharacterized protein n=1 Tax=marine sediment metagenome TaxID=412755 RepID=A0A0F9THZ4_9ZZZZ
MKKAITKQVDFCDTCDNGGLTYICLGCGKCACYDCKKKGEMIEYSHAVHFSGSGDGNFCPDCVDKPPNEKIAILLAAYRKISSLRTEEKGWYDNFRTRCDKAEAELKALIE